MSGLWVGQPAIGMLADPLQRLACATGDNQRNAAVDRGRQQLQALFGPGMRHPPVRARLQPTPHLTHRAGEALTSRRVLQPVGGKLQRTITGGNAHHQAPTGQLIDRRRRLRQIDRMAQWQHHAAGGQSYALRARRQPRKVGEWIEQLARIAEHRVVQRHITHPHRGKAVAVDVLHQPRLALQHGHVALVEAQWQVDAQGQCIGAEHALVAWVRGKDRG